MTRAQISVLIILIILNCATLVAILTLLQKPYRDIAIALCFVGYIVWSIVEDVQLAAYEGPLKLGVLVRRENLPKDIERFLHRLSQDIRQEDNFIRKEDTAVLVWAGGFPLLRRGWRYVAYIDLNKPNPQIEYRTGITGLFFTIPFALTIIGIPFIAAIILISHLWERGAVYHFIRENMERS